MNQPDLYAVLGVSRDADADTIKKAYRKLARQLHPDVNPDPEASARFQEVGRAYEILSDPQKRAAYDRGGDPFAGMGGFGQGAGFSFTDIMDAFFGGPVWISTLGNCCSHASASSSVIIVLRPIFLARRRPVLISSKVLVRPGP